MDETLALRSIWIVGDNFAARSIREGFVKQTAPLFIKEAFDYKIYCGSRHDSNDTNMLSRIRNSLARGLNKNVKLPNYILVVLDRDLIDYLDYDSFGISTMLGNWFEWLAAEFDDMIQKRKQNLPKKALDDDHPQIYWCASLHHILLEKDNLNARMKMNAVMDSVTKLYQYMRVIKIKEIWQNNDSKLVTHNRFTPHGLSVYWKAIDAAVQFNVKKHDEFLISKRFFNLKNRSNKNRNSHCNDKGIKRKGTPEDAVPDVFRRFGEQGQGKRFRNPNRIYALPKAPACKQSK